MAAGIQRERVLPLPEFALILNRELRQTSEYWWFFTELDRVAKAIPPSQPFRYFYFSTKFAHFRCAILGLCQLTAPKDVSLKTFAKQLKGFREHAALRKDIDEFLARTANHLKGVKLIRDLMVAHWDGKNDHGFVIKQANTNIDLIDEFLVEAEVLRERVAALAGVRYKRVVREDIEASVMEGLMRT